MRLGSIFCFWIPITTLKLLGVNCSKCLWGSSVLLMQWRVSSPSLGESIPSSSKVILKPLSVNYRHFQAHTCSGVKLILYIRGFSDLCYGEEQTVFGLFCVPRPCKNFHNKSPTPILLHGESPIKAQEKRLSSACNRVRLFVHVSVSRAAFGAEKIICWSHDWLLHERWKLLEAWITQVKVDCLAVINHHESRGERGSVRASFARRERESRQECVILAHLESTLKWADTHSDLKQAAARAPFTNRRPDLLQSSFS